MQNLTAFKGEGELLFWVASESGESVVGINGSGGLDREAMAGGWSWSSWVLECYLAWRILPMGNLFIVSSEPFRQGYIK